MSTEIKTCPLCGLRHWALDGKVVVEFGDFMECRVNGYAMRDILKALDFAVERGWKPSVEPA